MTNYFAMPGTKGSGYLDLSANVDLGGGWGVNAHLGRLFLRGFRWARADGSSHGGSYSDWRLGLTKDISGWVIGAAYVGSNAQGGCGNGEFYCFANAWDDNGNLGGKSKNAGRGVAVLSVSKNF